MKKILLFIAISILQSQNCFAYIFYSKAATNDVATSKNRLLIIEVSFKNKLADYLVLQSHQNTNLKAYSIWTDSKLFEFKNDFFLDENQNLKISFKSDIEEITNEEIKIKSSGLVSTTEQLSLLNKQGSIIDAICWRNKNPSQSEIEDEKTLVTIGQWKGHCLNSEEVGKNEAITRKNLIDTNTKSDWQISKEAQNPTKNYQENRKEDIKTQSIKEEKRTETVEQKNSENKQRENSNTYTDQIEISEIMPNPKGKDKGAEWIELYNSSNQEVYLSGWRLDDEEGGSKPYSFTNQIIPGNSYLPVHDLESKLTLNNSEDSVRLIAPDGTIKHEVYYEQTIEGSSYLPKKQKWTLAATPGMPNIEIEIEEDEEGSAKETDLIENGDLSKDIEISEVFPNPKGTDIEEWIELYNKGNKRVRLGNWKLGNSKKEKILSNEIYIDAQDFTVIYKEDFGFSLKNSNEKITLIDFEGQTIDEISYDKSIEDKSFGKTEDANWFWLSPSPMEENSLGVEEQLKINNLIAEPNQENSNTPLKTDNKKWKLFSILGFLLILSLIIQLGKKYSPLIKIYQIKKNLREKHKKALQREPK